MTDQTNTSNVDYSNSLYLPHTDMPMRAGLPQKEPEFINRWDKIGIYDRLREQSEGREKWVLHDGPPYANGNLHIGHALNKILKDIINRSFQMRGFDAPYVPGWDCHGLPIEWKVEEKYRAKGKNKDEVPVNEFRAECRAFAAEWVKIQSGEFRRLGVEGDFNNPYTTMAFNAEARIAGELMKFATTGQLYRGSKPVMWSVVEKTALAEAEVEYHTYESDTVWVKFPVRGFEDDPQPQWIDASNKSIPSFGNSGFDSSVRSASIVIWTTTPWTIPANRAISFSHKIAYGVYEVTSVENDFGPQVGDKFIVAQSLAYECAQKAKIEWKFLAALSGKQMSKIYCDHPLKGLAGGYEFKVPLLDGDHVSDEAGTGFVHTAPGHGRDDFDIWMSSTQQLKSMGIDPAIPYCVDENGAYTSDVPGFEGAVVIDGKGKKGDANKRVIEALIAQNNLFSRGRVKHEYPHSWRSKKPVIYRNTPQWFVYMDNDIDGAVHDTLRKRALTAIAETRFVPSAGQNRLRAMIENRPDWVLSRQRAWGVPITVFVHKSTGEILKDTRVNERIFAAFQAEGADAWFVDGARARFLAPDYNPEDYEKVTDILDVWFDSGSTHAFVLEDRPELKWPADLYLEGSDQHRGWFHSSLLESCGTRHRAPYEAVLTHGFTLDEKGRKMSKSDGNVVAPSSIIDKYGADILRLWVASSDYSEDLRIGETIINGNVDAYRKMRNTSRWLLGNLAHYQPSDEVAFEDMPELERYMLHRLQELGALVDEAYNAFDFKRIYNTLSNFMINDCSAFYFDIRKDALYCDAPSSQRRKACLTVLDRIFNCLTVWFAPILPFTCEEIWLNRYPSDTDSVHFQLFPEIPTYWADAALAAKWAKVRKVRKVVTGALEVERREKTIGSSLEAAPEVYISDEDLFRAVESVDMADVCIVSQISLSDEVLSHEAAFVLDDVKDVAVVFKKAVGQKCARSWKISDEIGKDADYPQVTLRDAQALRERAALGLSGAQ